MEALLLLVIWPVLTLRVKKNIFKCTSQNYTQHHIIILRKNAYRAVMVKSLTFKTNISFQLLI
ncbi:hypothetical protein PVAP13_1KG474305 [Panicum virgatum]|uniref:Uncharacterized protein n=1 Tax=Panicum virgatum TaxID=38727 RepID=A0A8T0XHQ9_PANVG|nr:hypothetical protein PVAP13_1KG474305 [Panicum virgatum]